MFSKSKTKKAFIDQPCQKQTEANSLNSLMRRFKSHDIYSTTSKQQPQKSNKQNNKINEGTTITINLNLPQTNLNINNWNQRPKNSKRVFSENHFDKKNQPLINEVTNQVKKDSVSLSHYNNNTSRIRHQIDTLKILDEESILELDTEENCKFNL